VSAGASALNTPSAGFVEPVTLAGRHATLVPLERHHAPALARAVADGELWRLWYTSVASPDAMEAEIDCRLALQGEGSMLPFAVLDPTGQAIGMTTYMNIDAGNRRLEVGSTWYAASVQRSGVNTDCKRMLLGHAFERLDCIAVELRTHRLNAPSRRAIERLGAQLDGILRAHQRMPDGALRDTAVYSITATEWPAVRTHLDWQLSRSR
jgi:RimJ/RimL family protein N-acetyltransferase